MKASNGWPNVKLGEHVELLTGFPFKSQRFTFDPNDTALVKGENVAQGRIDWEISKRWPADELIQFEQYRLRSGDVVLAMDRPWIEAGLKYAWIKPHDQVALLVQRVSRLRGCATLDQTFLRYVIGSPAFTNYIKPIVTGVNVPHISPQQIKDYRFRLPPIAIQRKAAAILCVYDDLIENNRRRIQILERKAQALYREWFVNFRFPGHAKVKLVASPLGQIPEGWGVLPLVSVVEDIVDYRGKTPTKLGGVWGATGIPALSALNVKAGRLVSLEKCRFVDDELYSRWMKTPLRRGDILMTSEAPLGELYFLNNEQKFCLSQRLFSIRSNSNVMLPVLLYLDLASERTRHELLSRATGATVLGIRQSELRKVPILVPPVPLQKHAAEILGDLIALFHSLETKNANLRRTRDLLLPKLISGALDVSKLDIETA